MRALISSYLWCFLLGTLLLAWQSHAQGVCCNGASCTKPWYLLDNPGATVSKVCLDGPKKFASCTSDADCAGVANSCHMPETSSRKYILDYMVCCKHCVWDMKFPVGSPIQVTAGPLLNETSELAVIPNLNCNNFRSLFDEVDTSKDGFWNSVEFDIFLGQTPQRQMVAQKMLDPDSMFWIADLNKDRFISFHEFIILRHFWTPTILARTAPSQGQYALAEGPLGGFFYDNSTVSVWVTTANNLMMRLYLTNKWSAAATREPREGEEKEHKRLRDLDGSQRISLEEHYFAEFADLNGDHMLSKEEFDLSLYSEKTVAGTPYKTRSSFALHDLDGNGEISFMERKLIMADRNEDNRLDMNEWMWADYPEEYGPFKGHVSEDGTLTAEQYRYYMSYHGCTVRGSLAYSRPLSQYPWDSGCPLKIVTHADIPFVTTSTAPASRRGIDNTHGGFAMRVLGNVTQRLLWTPTIEYITTPEFGLGPPDVSANSFKLALLTQYMKSPPEWTCSDSLFPDDGFVVVTRTVGIQINLYIIAGKLVISAHFINFFCSLFFTVLVVGHIMWAVERWTNAEIFRSFYGEGVMDGLWWAIVTQTTVGYGDKAPTSGLGKAFAILWMLFGLIMFGVFSGQVTAFIGEETAVNGITSIENVAGFTAGTLAYTRDLLLPQSFSFDNVNCQTMKECTDKLKNMEIDAIVAPRSDVINYFQTSGLANTLCGNPFKIIGTTIPSSSIPQAPPSIRVCVYSKSVYAAVYLTSGISTALSAMAQDGSLASIMAEEFDNLYIPTNEGNGNECAPETPWSIGLITTALLILVFYGCLINISESVRTQDFFAKMLGRPTSADLEKQKAAELEKALEDKANQGNDKVNEKPSKPDAEHLKLPGLTAEHAEEMIEASKKLGVFTAMQATDIRRMQREMKEQRYLLERMLKFFGLCGMTVIAALAAMVGILIVVWGQKLQISAYQ